MQLERGNRHTEETREVPEQQPQQDFFVSYLFRGGGDKGKGGTKGRTRQSIAGGRRREELGRRRNE